MNPSSDSQPMDSEIVSRRDAIKRTALMLGLALAPSLLAGLARAQTARTGAPRYLSAKQAAVAGAVAERILPRTDTPGARDVGVPAFLDLMYGEFMTPEEQRMFASGLEQVDSASRAAHQRDFVQLT